MVVGPLDSPCSRTNAWAYWFQHTHSRPLAVPDCDPLTLSPNICNIPAHRRDYEKFLPEVSDTVCNDLVLCAAWGN